MFCDATFCKVRVGAHVVSQALVVATGVSIDGTREVLGTAVGDSESYEFWREFLASLKARGLTGVHLVISDAHAGLKAAVAQQFTNSSWQRCRVHFMRNLHTAVAAKHAPAVTARSRRSSPIPTPPRSPPNGTVSLTLWRPASRKWRQ